MPNQVPIQIRLPKELLKRVDAHAVEMRREHPERLWTRSEVVRQFVEDGLRRAGR